MVGCFHPRMEHILKTASRFGKVYGIIGAACNQTGILKKT